MSYQQNIKKIIDHINRNLIAEIPRNIYNPEEFITRSNFNQQNFVPVTTTMLVLNTCLGNNTLIEGGAGMAKTQLASVAGSLLFQIPYEMFERRRLVGADGSTINEMYATHDIGELNRGRDVAFLYLTFYAPLLIVDELNRYNPIGQNIIREGIATNIWNYTNHSWNIKNQIVISAINPESYGGTFAMNENLVDNYSIVLEPPYFNPFYHHEHIVNAHDRIKSTLGMEELINQLGDFYSVNKNDNAAVKQKMAETQALCKNEFLRRGLPILDQAAHAEIKKEIAAMEFDSEAYLFFYSVFSEMTYSRKFGRLRYDDPISDNSHDLCYASTMIKESLAGRFFKDWDMIAKSIAWYFGKKTVCVEDLKAAFFYTAPKRLKINDEFLQETMNSARKVPIQFKAAQMIIEKAWTNYSGFTSKNNGALTHVRDALDILNGKRPGLSPNQAYSILEKVDCPIASCMCEAIANYLYDETRNK